MNIKHRKIIIKITLALTLILSCTVNLLRADTGTCGGSNATLPFLDVAGNQFFCQIAEAYVCGLTHGTTATTYSPNDAVPREQMAAFITRAQDSALRRGSRRAALNQWATPQGIASDATTTVGGDPQGLRSDGADIWVANYVSDTVSRVRASDGKLLETWTGADGATDVLVAEGHVYVTGSTSGKLYSIDPKQPAGAVTTIASNLGTPHSATWDGANVWTAGTKIAKINPHTWTSQTFTTISQPEFILFDGVSVWVDAYDNGTAKLYKLNPDGSIALTVAFNINSLPQCPAFDGTNIWVPSGGNEATSRITVVRAATGEIVATLTGNGMDIPNCLAFDGQRILATNGGIPRRVSLWMAADLAPLGFVDLGNFPPSYACSDGINFWISGPGKIARF